MVINSKKKKMFSHRSTIFFFLVMLEYIKLISYMIITFNKNTTRFEDKYLPCVIDCRFNNHELQVRILEGGSKCPFMPRAANIRGVENVYRNIGIM